MKKLICLILTLVLCIGCVGCIPITNTLETLKVPDSKEVFLNSVDSVVEIRAQSSNWEYVGTGFFIDNMGTVVTNYHVIDGCTSAYISISDGGKYNVLSVIGYNKKLDIAILTTEKKITIPLAISSKNVKTGEKVYAIGSSLGLTSSFSDGMISAETRELNGIKYIQTTTPISHGNSGGPLLDEYGKVVGITTAGFEDGQNLNLAVPISYLNDIDQDLSITLEELCILESPYKNICKILHKMGQTNKYGHYGDYSSKVTKDIQSNSIWDTFEIYDTGKVISVGINGKDQNGNNNHLYMTIKEDGLTCNIDAFGILDNLFYEVFDITVAADGNCILNKEMLYNLPIIYGYRYENERLKASATNPCYTLCLDGISYLFECFDYWLSKNIDEVSLSDFGIEKDMFNN